MVGFCLDTCHAHAGGNAARDRRRRRPRDHRADRPGALQRQPRRLRLRRRPARQPRRGPDRPRPARRRRPRRRRAGRAARRPAAPPSTSPTSPGCASGSEPGWRSALQPREGLTGERRADRRPGERRPATGRAAMRADHRPDHHAVPEHLAFLAASRSASFLQTPAWGRVKSEWRRRVARLVRRRRRAGRRRAGALPPAAAAAALPGLPARGPGHRLGRRRPRGLARRRWPPTSSSRAPSRVRMGPPVVTRRWSAAPGQGGHRRPGRHAASATSPPLERDAAGARVVSQLRELGWRRAGGRGRLRRRAAAATTSSSRWRDDGSRAPRTTSSRG